MKLAFGIEYQSSYMVALSFLSQLLVAPFGTTRPISNKASLVPYPKPILYVESTSLISELAEEFGNVVACTC